MPVREPELSRHVPVELEIARAFAGRLSAAEGDRDLLRAAVSAAPYGLLVLDGDGHVLAANGEAAALIGETAPDSLQRWDRARGWRPDGTPLSPADWPGVRALRGERVEGEEIDVERPDGLRVTVLASAAPVRDEPGCLGGAVVAFADVTRLKRAEERALARERAIAGRTARLHAVTAELSLALTPEDVARAIVRAGVEAVGARGGGVWEVEQGGRTARLMHASGLEMARHFERVDLHAPAPAPIADAIARVEPSFAGSRAEVGQRYPELEVSLPSAPQRDFAFACLPLEAEGRAIGGASFVFDGARRFDEEDRVYLLVLARHGAQALARARLYASERAARADAEAAQRRAAFLAEASAILGSSLEYGETLSTVARLAVPRIADWCSVDLAETLVPGAAATAVAHVDPAKVEMAREFRRRWPPEAEGATGVGAVIRSGRSELYPQITDEMLVAAARDEGHLGIIRELGMTSVMVVPLSARGRTLGAITFVATSESGRHYGAADLMMAEDVGRRAGLAVDNARLYDEAQRAVRARDDVLAIVSHDLKNPLGAVLLSASLLARATAADARLHRYASTIQASATRMDRLIRDLLDLSSIEAGRFRVEARPERIEDVVEEATALLSPLAHEKGIVLAWGGTPHPAPIPFDRERVLQVLSNLVGNALQFTPEGGNVTVRIVPSSGSVRVEVADDGPGIPEAELAHVFDRYWKSRSRRGTGLGLSIAKGIVEAHGGAIGVESKLGAGSAFWFTLPAR